MRQQSMAISPKIIVFPEFRFEPIGGPEFVYCRGDSPGSGEGTGCAEAGIRIPSLLFQVLLLLLSYKPTAGRVKSPSDSQLCVCDLSLPALDLYFVLCSYSNAFETLGPNPGQSRR